MQNSLMCTYVGIVAGSVADHFDVFAGFWTLRLIELEMVHEFVNNAFFLGWCAPGEPVAMQDTAFAFQI